MHQVCHSDAYGAADQGYTGNRFEFGVPIGVVTSYQRKMVYNLFYNRERAYFIIRMSFSNAQYIADKADILIHEFKIKRPVIFGLWSTGQYKLDKRYANCRTQS